jgi:hypothetical protein
MTNPINDALLQLLATGEEPHYISDKDTPDLLELTDQLCPKLEGLNIFIESNISEGALLTFISRKNEHTNKSHKLKNIDVCFHHPKVHDIMPNLSAFIASGLKVRIGYPHMEGPRFSLYDGLLCDDELEL